MKKVKVSREIYNALENFNNNEDFRVLKSEEYAKLMVNFWINKYFRENSEILNNLGFELLLKIIVNGYEL